MADESKKIKRGVYVWDDSNVPKELRDAYKPIITDEQLKTLPEGSTTNVEAVRQARIAKAHVTLEDNHNRTLEKIAGESALFYAGKLEMDVEKLEPEAEKGRKFKAGRQRDAKSDNTLYIKNLVKSYPSLPAKELYRKADVARLGGIKQSTFIKKVSIAKNPKI